MTGSDEHIKPLRLFDIARDSALPVNEDEHEHFRVCEECQRILNVFVRQFGKREAKNKPDNAA